ncbi:MAG: AmmeMemoRadiSam system radical SAM enzyme [Deltaproteobacteria bacterium]|nr:AmmeMemoRadiSam system radical SAM enzyme [Deltaproteobacteria bacterium]MBN2673050.1 AmmeMemoRadiSam system radical SAM enzyme [Deltaproteobacteria bacterium]
MAACGANPLFALDSSSTPNAREAMHYEKLSDRRVRCQLCPRECVVADLERGTCGVRENRDGKYFTLVHSNPCALNNDPIEKKPLFHFHPGINAFSLATAGCNMECRFCQNWEISQFRPEQVPSERYTPDDIVVSAQRVGAGAIAFTYSEPVIFYEYMRDICLAARGTGLGRVMISNGYIQSKPMKQLLPYLDAVKIDFKAFSESFYRDTCSAHLAPVLKTLQLIHDAGVWLELVILVIPTLNDSEREFDAMTRWVVQKLGRDVPLHFTRFHPMYKLQNLPPTPVSTLEKAREIALKNGVRYAYAGNVPGHPSENTVCPFCHTTLIQRRGFHIMYNRIQDSRCPKCKKTIAGKWHRD